MSLGDDLFVAFSPERVYSGRVFADLRRYPKLVGGIDETSTKLAIDFYESVLQFDHRDDLTKPNGVWDLGNSEAAELAKLAETTYRDINIGFANELARHADQHDIDVAEVIEACNSQPFSHIHQPGIAVGGIASRSTHTSTSPATPPPRSPPPPAGSTTPCPPTRLRDSPNDSATSTA